MDAELLEILRQEAQRCVEVPKLIQIVLERMGSTSRFAVIQYFMEAFGIPLSVARDLGGWTGFGDEDGYLSDEAIQRLVAPAIIEGLRHRSCCVGIESNVK